MVLPEETGADRGVCVRHTAVQVRRAGRADYAV